MLKHANKQASKFTIDWMISSLQWKVQQSITQCISTPSEAESSRQNQGESVTNVISWNILTLNVL